MARTECIAPIIGDPDIGGPGVMASFLFTAWLTVVVTFVLTYFKFVHDLPIFWRAVRAWPDEPTPLPQGSTTAHRPAWAAKLEDLLQVLSDLQLITGIAIVIAGFAQLPKLTYYHEQLINSYWWLTFYSFWADRMEYSDEDLKEDLWRINVRRVVWLVNVILGASFQTYIVQREKLWNDDEGPCYRGAVSTSPWPWVASNYIYSLALISLLIPKSQERCYTRWFKAFKHWQQTAYVWFRSTCRVFKTTSSPSNFTVFENSLKIGIGVCLVALNFLVDNFLSVIGYGRGFYPLLKSIYLMIAIWNTSDIVMLKASNNPIVGDENKMGFGQVLPLVLLISVVFNWVDVFKDEMHVKQKLKLLKKEIGLEKIIELLHDDEKSDEESQVSMCVTVISKRFPDNWQRVVTY